MTALIADQVFWWVGAAVCSAGSVLAFLWLMWRLIDLIASHLKLTGKLIAVLREMQRRKQTEFPAG